MDELAGALERIDGLQVFAYPPDRVTPPSAVVSWPTEVLYDQTMARGSDQQTFPVHVVVSQVDARSTRDNLAGYLDGAGAVSVKAALDSGIYTACDSVRVVKAHVEPVHIAGIDYLAATFDVEVIGRGGI